MALSTHHRAQARFRRTELGGWFDDAVSIVSGGLVSPVNVQNMFDKLGGQSTSVCLAQANQQQAAFDAQTADLATNWIPPDTFTPDQVTQIVNQTMALVIQAQQAIVQAQSSWSGDPSDLTNANDALIRQTNNGVPFLSTAQQAASSNALVSASTLKNWVLFTLNAVSNTYVTIYVIKCQEPAWISAIAGVLSAVQALVSMLKSIVGAAITAGQAVLTVGSSLITFATWAPWVVLASVVGLSGFLIYRKYRHP